MFKYLAQIWNSPTLRKKILFTIGVVVLFRLTTQISIPGANIDAVRALFQQNTFLGVFSALTGGSAENFSIVLMGLSPYINASIIMQLLAVIVPKLEAASKEPNGQRTINKYARYLTLPIALLQSYGTILLLNSQTAVPIFENIRDPRVILPVMLIITTGTVFLMWLGEIITERGIGNGISILIFASIISGMPQIIAQNLFLSQTDAQALIPLVSMVLFTIILLVAIVLVTEAERRIPVTYASSRFQGRGQASHLPIRLLQAGMIPIIFAVSLVSFPSLLGQFFVNSDSATLQTIGDTLSTLFVPNGPTYLITYFIFIIIFSYFYVSITFNPKQVAENIQKRGGYIPGIRPGSQTAEFLGKVSMRLNLFGGLFLAVVAVAPIIFASFIPGAAATSAQNLISGAGLIIIVGVILEIVRQVNAQLIMHDYEKLT
ncbi:preprotein translocase subunit SecY [Candidatus Peregrinibacteria bacterium CG11_big_fil_rev_8_21_14_0_20_46_8]|nr:MAG: preprotein translocase subunit SecY [Candidatus Peregrinibacteria bacterium CG11_big_fil_rev_8_21_14_0_20_46_8]